MVRFRETAAVMSREDCEALEAFASKRSAELAMEYMQSADARLRETGAIVAGELHLTEAIPQLQQLLQEKTPESDHANVGMGMGAFPVDPARAAQRAWRKSPRTRVRSRREHLCPPKQTTPRNPRGLARGEQTHNNGTTGIVPQPLGV